jgi:nucleotide-binding universal stress UspA family protein
MAVYERILVPVEGTDTDDPVLEHIARLAPVCGAEVVLLRVAHYHTRDERLYELEDAEADMERAAELLRSRGITVRSVIAHGEPAEVILAQAQELKPDLIAMATHGHGWAKRIVLGSVADHIRHNTDIPLLLLKAHGGEGRTGST